MLAESVRFSHPWPETTIGAVASVEVGGTPSTAIPSFWGGDIPWMSSGDVHQRRISDVPGRITASGLRSSNAEIVDAPAVAIALAGQGKTRGTVGLALTPLCTNQSVALIRGRPSVLDTTYLFHALEARYEEFRARSAGGGRAGLSKAIIESVPLPLPSLREQYRIAKILDAADAAIRETEALISKLKQTKIGLMHDLLTHGLDECGQLRDPDTHPERFEARSPEAAYFASDWVLKPLGEVANISSGVTLGRRLSGSNTVELPYLRVANVQDGFLDLSEVKTIRVPKSEVPRYLLQSGDVLMNEGGDFDKLGRGTIWSGQIDSCLHQNHVFKVRPDRRHLLPEFLTAVTGSNYGKRFFVFSSKQSTNLASINSTQLRAFPVPCPPVEEQYRIVEVLDAHNVCIRAEEAYRDKLKLQKVGLMEDLLTGKVRVSTAQGVGA